MGVSIRDFGAIADGFASCTQAIQAAIDAAAGEGGGVVVVPPGRYVTGALQLRSHITLHLEAGAVLLGSEEIGEFPIWSSAWEGPGVKPGRRPMIGGEDLEHVALTGRGIIDGRGKIWWDSQRASPGKARRPMLFRLVNCRNVLVEGVTFRNSPIWTVSPLACDNVTIRRITIENPADSPNTDGINPDSCRHVRISDCHVDVGDDCITIKSGKEDDGRREFRACENITITNCTLMRGHGGVVIGSEITGGVRNVVISNCVFSGTDRGIRFKARRGRGGVAESISVNNVVMEDVGAALTMNLFYGCGAWNDAKVTDQSARPADAQTPVFRNLRFSHITATRVRWAGIYALGLPEMPIENVAIDHFAVSLDRDNKQGGVPIMAPKIEPSLRSGVVMRHVKDSRLTNVTVRDALGPTTDLRDCPGTTLDNCSDA